MIFNSLTTSGSIVTEESVTIFYLCHNSIFLFFSIGLGFSPLLYQKMIKIISDPMKRTEFWYNLSIEK